MIGMQHRSQEHPKRPDDVIAFVKSIDSLSFNLKSRRGLAVHIEKKASEHIISEEPD